MTTLCSGSGEGLGTEKNKKKKKKIEFRLKVKHRVSSPHTRLQTSWCFIKKYSGFVPQTWLRCPDVLSENIWLLMLKSTAGKCCDILLQISSGSSQMFQRSLVSGSAALLLGSNTTTIYLPLAMKVTSCGCDMARVVQYQHGALDTYKCVLVVCRNVKCQRHLLATGLCFGDGGAFCSRHVIWPLRLNPAIH